MIVESAIRWDIVKSLYGRKWKEKEQRLKQRNKRLKEQLRASRANVARKKVTIKTLRKKVALKITLHINTTN